MQRRGLLQGCAAGVLAVLSTSLAGCSTETNEGESTPTGTPEPTATETETATPTPVTDLPTYQFTEGESYTYDTVLVGSESVEVWTVTSVEGDEITVERKRTADGETETATYSGPSDNIFDIIDEERDLSVFPLARALTIYRYLGDLTAGNTFTVDAVGESNRADWDSETVEVVGETTVNGVSCTELTATPDTSDGEEQQRMVCVADGYPFAVSLTIESDGEPFLEMSLTDATRP